MPFEHTITDIADYAKQEHFTAYIEAVCKYEAMKKHANGEMPEHIICNRRPGESDRIKEYRKEIYEPITKPSVSKVITSLSKIRRSPDWSIHFKNAIPSIIRKEEALEQYIKVNYPNGLTSLENWLFNIALKEYLIDSNAVIMVLPISWKVAATDYRKPFPIIYNSTQVLHFRADEYAILLSEEKCIYNLVDNNGVAFGSQNDGKIIFVIDDEKMYRYEQVNQRNEYRAAEVQDHGLGFFPGFKMPGVFFKTCENIVINESRIDSMLSGLNEAARIYSDLQAEFVQHIHSDRWEIMNTKCTHCQGTGTYHPDNGDSCACGECKGSGYVPTSPYTVRVLTPPEMGQEMLPMPPAGYIQKTDVAEMCTTLKNEVQYHLFSALAAINMQNIDQVPLNISGVGKEVDRDEQSNFYHSVAEDLVYIADKIVFITNEYRTGALISDPNARKELLPVIAVPDRFDIYTIKDVREEVGDARKQSLNGFIIAALENEYAAKKFYNEPEIADFISLAYRLDPLVGLMEDDKTSRLGNRGISRIDYVLSSNIIPFIKRAVRENPKFKTLSEEDQLQILLKYAEEKINVIDLSGRLTEETAAAEDANEEIDDTELTEEEVENNEE